MQRSNACSAKILSTVELRSSHSSAMDSQMVRMIDKGYRAHMMLEKSNAQQREPQRAGFEYGHELISHPPHPGFIYCVCADSLVGNQPLQRGTMPLILCFS